MKKVKIAVLVSGGGTNLQALIDAQGDVLRSGEILSRHRAARRREGHGDHARDDVDLVEDACQRGVCDVKEVDPRHENDLGKADRRGRAV